MSIYLLFGVAALLLLGLIAMIWRLWNDYAQVSPADEQRDRELASLNDSQANRVSDQQLTHPADTDSAWQTMVQRGAGAVRRSRPSRRPPRKNQDPPR